MSAHDVRGRVVVFAGPSLPPRHRPDDPRLVWRPPAKAGDGIALSSGAPEAVVLVDGVFDETPSIRHKELLMLLGEGVRVLGGASMGALRAAELNPFGMIGVGRIFTAYARGRLTGDDEVAVAHAPAELDWRPLSEPLVNVRATLQWALRQGVIGRPAAAAVLGAARGQFYRERTWAGVLAVAEGEPACRPGDLDRFRRWLPSGRVDQKLLDAMACVAAALASPPPPARSRPMPPATIFTAALASQVIARSA